MVEAGQEDLPGCWGRAGVGCVTLIAGLFSGAMVGVLVSRIAAGIMKAPKCEGLPTCDWYIYAFVGGIIGAITLPALAFRRLGKKK